MADSKRKSANLWDENYIDISDTLYYLPLYVGSQKVTMSTTTPLTSSNFANLFILAGQASSGAKTDYNGVYSGRYLTVTPINGYVTLAYRNSENVNPQDYDTMLNEGNIALPYEPYGWIHSIKMYDGTNWIDAVVNEWDGSQWS